MSNLRFKPIEEASKRKAPTLPYSEIFSGKKLFFASLGVVGYFCFLILDYYILHIDKPIKHLIQFIHELIGLPLLFLVQPTLLVFSIIHCVKDKFRIKTYSFWSFLILLVSNAYFGGGIIIHIIERIGKNMIFT